MALSAWAGSADAAGLGRLMVTSGLGQPLQAEVEITSVSPDEAASLSARLASPDAFRAAGLQFNNALSGLRMAVQQRGGRHFIRITSSSALNEPFVDLMVELNWASGKFVREYTFLLDPPELRASRQTVEGGTSAFRSSPSSTARAASPPSQPRPSQPPQSQPSQLSQSPRPAQDAFPGEAAVAPPVARAATGRGSPAGAAPVAANAAGDSNRSPDRGDASPLAGRAARPSAVTVSRGDSLGKIAAAVKPADATLEQTIVAIHQANRAAFIDNNPNLIRQGRTLSIPDDAAIAAVDPGAAQRQLRLAAENFRTYKSRLATAPREIVSPGTGTTASGTVSAEVDENAGRPAPADRLELSKSTGAGARQAGSIASSEAEARIARDAAFAESSGRIAELERNVANLQKMLELKNRSMSDLQAQLDRLRAAPAGGAPAPGSAAPPGPPPGSSPAAGSAPTVGSSPAAGTAGPAPSVATAPSAAGNPAAGLAPPAGDAGAGQVGAGEPGSPSPASTPAGPGAPQPASGPVPTAAPAASAAAQPTSTSTPTTMLSGLTDNPLMLPALGGLALLAIFGLWAAMRRRHADRFEDSLSTADPYAANSLFGTTREHPLDTRPGTPSQITAMSEAALTEVDPIAEADVYIAYGRDAQAEEILKEAIRRQPDRQALRLKLMEIYSTRKDAQSFEAAAREMYAATGGQNEEWSRVAAMGLALERDNPLYSGGAPQAAAFNSSFGRATAATSMAAASSAAVFARPPLQDVPPPSGRAPSVDPGAALTENPPAGERPDVDFHVDFDQVTQPEQGRTDDFDEPLRFGPSTPGPLSAMPGVELPSLDLDMPPPSPPPPPPIPVQSDGGFDADIASLGLEPTRPRPSFEPVPDPMTDFPTIGADLESLPSRPAAAGPTAGQWQEMASKLDLASAYGEIGDKEGARELLQEVVAGGDASQRQKAQELLAAI